MENSGKSTARLYWLWAWMVIVAASAVPLGRTVYQQVVELNFETRHRFIVEYELWRAHPQLSAAPRQWARMASRLLTDNQIMNRLRVVHPNNAQQIELDYRRDLSIAQAITLGKYLLPWALIMGLLYFAGWRMLRPRAAPPLEKAVPASYNDPRYRE